jgi:uncharacterized protein YbjT (DUF2867 family)
MTILLLGGTGKTARRIAPRLRLAGASVRTAARSNADVPFDWDDPTTHDAALEGIDAVYLVPPSLRLDHAPLVIAFLDRAQAAGVTHVTALSARGVNFAPPEAAMRAIELDLLARTGLTTAILRPGWFMQDFDEYVFAPAIVADGTVVAPAGDGTEAFIHVDDIADVAAATLLDPDAHVGAEYELAGPEALSFAQVAEKIAAATGREIRHVDPPRDEWVAGLIAEGVPQDYAGMLGMLLDNIRAHATAASTPDVERVTGRAPRTFDDYAAQPSVVAAWTAPSAVSAAS